MKTKARMAFDGAASGRRFAEWISTGPGPNSALRYDASVLRARVQELIRNNPWVYKASRNFTSNLIGQGVRPISETPDAALSRDLMSLWEEWIYEADVTGRTSFYGLQTLVANGVFGNGEGILRRVIGADDNALLPLQYQAIEADFIVTNKNETGGAGKPRIICGVEMGEYRPAAYHLYKSHPNDGNAIDALSTIRVPADEILHVFETFRAGQVRGYPRAASALVRLMDMMEYEESELVRKKMAAMLVGFVTTSIDPDAASPLAGMGQTQKTDADGSTFFEHKLEPATMQALQPGEDIKFNEPADVGGSYEAFMKVNQRAIAAGMDATYEQVSGDYEGVTFSSLRAAKNEMERMYRQTQEQTISPQLVRPVWLDFVKYAVLSGQVKLPRSIDIRAAMRARYVPPGWTYVDPLVEEKAAQLAIRGGTDTRTNVAARKGMDIASIDEQQKIDQERADSMGLIYDTDPRRVSGSGNPVIKDEEEPSYA